MHPALFDVVVRLAQQIDPSQGTGAARRGAVQRLQEPSPYDLVFPLIAFVLVIVLPTSTALWVIWRTAKDKTREADER